MKKFNLSKGLIVGLLTFALCIVAFAAVGASAAEEQATVTPPSALTATYSYADNAISCASNAVVYVLKQEKSNVIKKGAAASGTIAAGKSTALVDLKVKGTTKDVYLYVCDKEFEDEGKVDANLVIKAQAAKKVVGKIDYTKADITSDADPNFTKVLSITATDKNKKAIENPECIWSSEIDGTYESSTTFTGAKLAKMLEDGGGVIYVKMVGANDPAQFASKAIKVKVAKQAKAPKIKYDEKKDALKLGNGYDFGFAEKVGDKYTVSTWYTILPVLKDATKKEAAESIVATSTFVPCDKKDADVKANTTQYKFKLISMDTIANKIGKLNDDFILAVRKSATSKKPASEATYVEYKKKTLAPIVWTANKVAGEFDIATVTDFDKKGFTIGTVANYNGENGTEGFWNTFKLADAGEGADKNPAAYEFCVVKEADLATIDWTTVSWKKLDPAKTKINGKLKTKYTKIGATSATEAVLKAFNKPDRFTATAGLPDGIESILLVRRAGVKGDSPVRPSDYIMLYVIKDGKNYTLYSTAAVGDTAKKYTVKFFKYSPASGNDPEAQGYKAAGFYQDASISEIVGYTKKNNTGVELEALTNAKYFKLDVANVNTGLANLITENEKYVEYAAENSDVAATDATDAIKKGAYSIAVGSNDAKINIAIREYATASVKAIYGEWKDSKFVPVAGDAFTKESVAYVKDGKVAEYDSEEKKLVLGNTVTAYIGSEVTIPTAKLDPYIPGGYVFDNTNAYKIAGSTGEGYKGLGFESNNLKFTIEETGDIVVEISVCINPIVVTIDGNGGKIKDGAAEKTTITLNPGLDGKITLPAEANLVPPTNKVFDSFNTKNDGSGDAVTGDKVYSADTTIYVKWKDAPAG